MSTFPNLTVVNHPLLQDKLKGIRNRNTHYAKFRHLIEAISMALFWEASKDLPLKKVTVETPLESTDAFEVANDIALVPILRAGLGMVNGILTLVPQARVGMLGMYRNEETLQPVDYYLRFPPHIEAMNVFLLDPMLATGGSAVAAVEKLKAAGVQQLKMLAIIAAPEGVQLMQEKHPEVPIFTAALDRELNKNGYILPGLGDAGDRYFGT